MSSSVDLKTTDFWVKVVGMLQQNWALIEEGPGKAVSVHFISDTCGVCDEIAFPSTEGATEALVRNGFKRFAEHPDLQSFLRSPSAPFHRSEHPNGPIYSSGRYWRL